MNNPEYLARQLNTARAELATLKREHEQLREAALNYMSNLASQAGKDALRAALGVTTAEHVRELFDPDAVCKLLEFIETGSCDGTYRDELAREVRRSERRGTSAYAALRAFCERASRMTSAEWTPEVRHELGRILDLGRE